MNYLECCFKNAGKCCRKCLFHRCPFMKGVKKLEDSWREVVNRDLKSDNIPEEEK